jgi:DNA polymerase-3 subunit gamma/tau
MPELALYRKYRPQKFKDVLGQEHVVKALQGALKEEHIAHAYLFFGSRGTGKTSIARIFAREIGASDNDIHEIDAASYNSVEDIRQLREEVNILPFESRTKVYILDETHMLSKAAWNAFLKTLEEPPAHAVFILATTELEKVPETVQSRCQVFTFKKPSQGVLREMVKKVAKAEGFALEQSAADLIALLADGSFRDAHGILQKIIAGSDDKEVSVAEVETVTGAPRGELVNRVISAVAKKDLEAGLAALREAAEKDTDMAVFARLLLHKLRVLLLFRYAPALGARSAGEMSEEDTTLFEGLAKDKSAFVNSEVLAVFIEAAVATARSPVPELPLELALMKLVDRL